MKYIYYLILLCSLPVLGQQDAETISWDEASINDKIKLTISKAEFDKRFKKADSIVEARPDDICGLDTGAVVQMVYYKGAKFELDNGIMNFRSVDFTKSRNIWFSIKDDWFDRTTTLRSFAKSFPEAASFIEEYTADDGEVYDMITILPADPGEEYEWRFYFFDDKLHAMECWFYCG